MTNERIIQARAVLDELLEEELSKQASVAGVGGHRPDADAPRTPV